MSTVVRAVLLVVAVLCQACPPAPGVVPPARDRDDDEACAEACADAEAECGVVEVGCPACGDCDEGESCGVGGANQCGVGVCAPVSCDDVGAECGTVSDGCADVLVCGVCDAGETCGRAGPNRCGDTDCTPNTCAAAGADCGLVDSGCGGTIACGTCDAGETCGGNGPNQCGVGACNPDSCFSLGADCGALSDGCADVVECGTCEAGETCGGGGDNVCGAGECTPRSCADVDAVCGSVSDGCGRTLLCGECDAGEVCGLDVDNQCAGLCANDCPTGFSCDASGLCTGGSSAGLDLDLDAPAVVDVSGTVTVNGGQGIDLVAGFFDGCVQLNFQSLDGLEGDTAFACASSDFAYEVRLFSGRYTISARATGNELDLPTTTQTVIAEIALTSTRTLDVDLDAPAVIDVSGAVTKNGGQDIGLVAGFFDGCVQLNFTNLDGVEGDTAFACASSDFAYEVRLFAGRYAVSARATGNELDLPTTTQTVVAEVSLTTTRTFDVDVDAPVVVDVSGTVTVNGGQSIDLVAGFFDGCVQLNFASLDGLEGDTAFACASSDFAYEVRLFSGRYTISARATGNELDLPTTTQTVVAEIALTSTRTFDVDLDAPAVIDVSGAVTKNGQDIGLVAGFFDGCVQLNFQNLDGLEGDTAFACASSDFAYAVRLFAGRYEVTARATGNELDLPTTTQTVIAEVSLTTTRTFNVDLDAPAVIDVTGTVTKNGGQGIGLVEGFFDGCVQLSFTSLDGLEGDTAFACASSDFAYAVRLFSGRYAISARATGNELDLPTTTQTVVAEVSLTTTRAFEVDLDAPAVVVVTGTVTKNGGQSIGLVAGFFDGCVQLDFTNLDGLEGDTAFACASSDFAYEVRVFAGRYAVSARASGNELDLPTTTQTVVRRLLIE